MSRVQLLAVVVLGLALAACGEQAGSQESTPSGFSSSTTPTAALALTPTALPSSASPSPEPAAGATEPAPQATARPSEYGVWVVDVTDGTAQFLGGGPISVFAWSPSGQEVAFTDGQCVGGGVNIASADGSNRRRVADTPAIINRITWSPPGDMLQYVTTRGANPAAPGTYRVPADRSAPPIRIGDQTQKAEPEIRDVAVALPNAQHMLESVLSPTGERLAVSAGAGPTANAFERSFIYTADPDGTRLRVLTELYGVYILAIRWSPDSARLALTAGVINACG